MPRCQGVEVSEQGSVGSDGLVRLQAELRRRLEVIEQVQGFAQRLLREQGIEAAVEIDEGDVVIVVPQVLPRPAGAGPGAAVPLPKQVPQAEVTAAPAPSPAAAAPAPALRVGEQWTEEEDARLLLLFGDGKTGKEVASALGRPVPGTYKRKKKLDASGLRAPAAPGHANENAKVEHVAPVVSAPPPPAPAPSVPLVRAAPAPAPGGAGLDGTPMWQRQLRAHLNALGHVAPWTPALDLRLVEGMLRGDGATVVAEALGVDRRAAVARMRALLPEPGIEAQARLAVELRRRAAAAEAAQ